VSSHGAAGQTAAGKRLCDPCPEPLLAIFMHFVGVAMIRTVPVTGIVILTLCCVTIAFWCACVPLWCIRSQIKKAPRTQKPIAAAFIAMYLLTGAVGFVGPIYVQNAFGGLPIWGMVTGNRYFLGKPFGKGYIEVSKTVYWFSHWLMIASGGSFVAMLTSAVAISTLNARTQRKRTAQQLDELCGRDDIESLRELVHLIDQLRPIPDEKNRERLCAEIRRRTETIPVLKPPLSVVATQDVLRQQKEMWDQFLREHEEEIVRGEKGTPASEA
jgi:hypothetical protein